MFLKFSARRSSARGKSPATTTPGNLRNKVRIDNPSEKAAPSSTLTSTSRVRRRRIGRACDNCRKHRIKCGEQRPCQYCSRTGKSCITTPQLHSQSSPRPNIMKDDGYLWLKQDSLMSDNNPRDEVVISPSPFLVASHEPSPLDQATDSDIPLMTRTTMATPRIHDNDVTPQLAPEIQSFFHACWQLSLPTSSPTSLESPFLQLPSPDLPGDEGSINTSHLSGRQRSYYMRCFRYDCHPLFPIIGEKRLAELMATSLAPIASYDNPVSGAFVDAMVALGIQHTHQTGVNQRVLGLHQPACAVNDLTPKTTTAAWPGFEYFCSSRSRLRNDPHLSLESLQCHVLLILYFINGHAYRDAYNLVGITVRKAYAAKLHRIPPAHLSEPMKLERMHLWWMLFYLDSKCSLQLDMPTAIRKELVTCPIPAAEDLARHVFTGADELIISAYSNRLIYLANIMAKTTTNQPRDGNGDISSDTLKNHLLRVSSIMESLDSWHTQQPENLDLPSSFRSYFKAESLTTDSKPSLPGWLQRQTAVLELAYHNTYTLSLRDFFCHPLANRKDATGDGDRESEMMLSRIQKYVTSAIEHSMKIIELAFDFCSTSDVFFGWSEILEPLWNAVITLMTSISIKSLMSFSGTEISDAITRAISIFHLFSISDLTAVSAKKLLELLTSYLQRIMTKECTVNNSTGAMWDKFFLSLEKQDAGMIEENILFFNV